MTEKQSAHDFIVKNVINDHSQQFFLQIVFLDNLVQIFFENLTAVLITDDLENYYHFLKLLIIIHKVCNHTQE